jgi:F0F1-type ATP synthase assembly protein I
MNESQKSDLIDVFHKNRVKIFAGNTIFAILFCAVMFGIGSLIDYVLGTGKIAMIITMVLAFPLLQFAAYKRSQKIIKNLSQK